MQYEIQNEILIISCDEETKKELETEHKENKNFNSDDFMFELFEDLIANSDLEWVDPEETGGLTNAPMLGIRGQDGIINQRWAFMGQVISVQEKLMIHGNVGFQEFEKLTLSKKFENIVQITLEESKQLDKQYDQRLREKNDSKRN